MLVCVWTSIFLLQSIAKLGNNYFRNLCIILSRLHISNAFPVKFESEFRFSEDLSRTERACMCLDVDISTPIDS